MPSEVPTPVVQEPTPAQQLMVACLVFAGIAALATTGFILRQISGDASALERLAWVGWATAPYAGFAALAVALRRFAASLAVLLTAIMAAAVLAVWGYTDMVRRPDAQGGLIVLFMPIYQWAGVLASGLLAALLAGMRASRG